MTTANNAIPPKRATAAGVLIIIPSVLFRLLRVFEGFLLNSAGVPYCATARNKKVIFQTDEVNYYLLAEFLKNLLLNYFVL